MLLPRERAPLARLGGLLGAMAVAGFFLYLVRTVATGTGGLGGEAPPAYFYIFAAIMIAGAVGVVCQPRPVYAALYFVLVTLAGAGIFVLLMAEFMAIVLIIIYAGAILVTYVFVIMLASQGSTGGTGGSKPPLYDRRASEPFVAVAGAFVLMGAVLQVLFPSNARLIAAPTAHPDPLMVASFSDTGAASGLTGAPAASTAPAAVELTSQPATVAIAATMPGNGEPLSNVQVLGASLYSHYAISLELAGILLTVALVGAVVIARKNTGPAHDALGTGKVPVE
jgi:NADH-quinone oxidoreductase subunit J